jgi:AmiR/NasT family two-component response regulator
MITGETMEPARVFVIWTHPLFHETVRRLLSEWNVSVVGATSDHRKADALIAELEPNVVILEESIEQDGTDEQETMSILSAGPNVIRLSLSDNEMLLYRREHRTLGKIEDLVHILTGDTDNSG